MKVNECYKMVAQLGFEDSLESDERFVYTLNRALLQVANLRPATRACFINHAPLPNAIQQESHSPLRVSESLVFECSDVKAYYFEACGNGDFYLDKETADGWTEFYHELVSANGIFKPYRGFIKDGGAFVSGTVRMRFAGDFLWHVRNVAAYHDIVSDNADEIPAFEAYTAYNIDDMGDDFLSLADPPIDSSSFHHALQNMYDIENGRTILLAREASGYYKVTYNHRPKEVVYANSVDEDETDIDLDEDLCALLPNLIASYVLLEDDPNMAQYYAALYNNAAMETKLAARNRKPVRVTNVTGW
jgi:hypothetical protein